MLLFFCFVFSETAGARYPVGFLQIGLNPYTHIFPETTNPIYHEEMYFFF